MWKTLVIVALALFAGPAPAQQPTSPDELVKKVMLDIQNAIVADKDMKAGDRDKSIRLIEEKALPYFDQRGMTALAVGVNWRKASPEQKERLVQEFRTLILRTYASSISAFADQKFEFRPVKLAPEDTETTVPVRIVQSGSQPVLVEYDMEKKPDGWKCYDVRIAGVSLVINYRTEFGILVRDKGIDGLIDALTKKNRSLDAKGGAGK
ncbi:MAG TPA: ABC transporter substrate-binding protein [Burkholderiales bacterium]|nr:ABC transporter substrate-binding protein [Burkholderiales bacterium]